MPRMTKEELDRIMEEVFGSDFGYVQDESRNHITIRVQDILSDGFKDLRVTPEDVVKYYDEEARNITSGCRTLAGLVGDWRYIDQLANMCLEWFKRVNRKALERCGKARGMQLR